jgi:hypothetical protein
MISKHSIELRNQISREFYWNNREKMLSYQKQYGARMREEARNRKKYETKEELFKDWNLQIIDKLENEELDDVIRTILIHQVQTNNDFLNSMTNGAQE